MNSILKKRVLLSLIVPIISFAQAKKEKIHVRIEQELDGKISINEKIISSADLSSKQKEDMIEKFKDSVLALNKGKAQGVRIEIDNDTDTNIEINGNDGKEDFGSRKTPKMKFHKRYDQGGFEDFSDEEALPRFHGNTESLRENMRQLGKDLKFEFRTIPDNFFDGGNSAKNTIKNVSVFSNNPKTEILNIRFNAPEKGDVSIKILDINGNMLAKEQIKDFSGEYVGQMNIGKQKTGTVFVLISQGEDGNVKRVVLPSN